jgi:hypothetical protein
MWYHRIVPFAVMIETSYLSERIFPVGLIDLGLTGIVSDLLCDIIYVVIIFLG